MIRVIITGGGTGGHIYPAIAIANAIRAMIPDAEILFVGAEGKMEMEKVPAAGYTIIGLPVAGFQRRLTFKNLLLPFKLLNSLYRARKIIKNFNPDVVVGVGGYASGPTLRVAAGLNIPSLLQEQNSFPGVTNRILASKVQRICVAYEGMSAFFPAGKIILTGNPIRKNIVSPGTDKHEALRHFGLKPGKKTLLVIGGSLGARTINEAVGDLLRHIVSKPDTVTNQLQVIWQTGKYYFSGIAVQHTGLPTAIQVMPFIERMDLAYTAADYIVSRAGAISISELCVVGKPVILIPSPNVAEDHQTKNALALQKRGAAIMIADKDARRQLTKTVMNLLNDSALADELSQNILRMAIPDAAENIAREVIGLCKSIGKLPDPETTQENLAEEVYFLGIGGIGMSALARYFRSIGASVSGYDKTPTALTMQLQEEGIPVHFEENVNKIPKNPGLIIYTPAIPSNNVEFQWFKINGKAMQKRAEVLGMISKKYQTIAVAGTHGKTTTTTMIAHMLQTAGLPYLAFLGGIPRNYSSNYLHNTGNSKPSETYCVVEADEYDRSFLQLEPAIAVVTSTDADHLDIYGHHGEMLSSFRDFTSRIKKGGSLFLKKGANISPENKNGYAVSGYSVQQGGDYFARETQLTEGYIHFDYIYPGGEIKGMTLQVPGLFNLENAIAALAVGTRLNIPEKDLRAAFATYQGVKRRFEFIIREQNCVYIDDYAHHPEELRACITTARALYPETRITGIFQPHLYTRTRDLASEFAESLGLLDEVILLDIYPARELPIEGVTSRLLLDKIALDTKLIVSKADLLPTIEKMRPKVLLTMGAGDIDQFTTPITQLLKGSRP